MSMSNLSLIPIIRETSSLLVLLKMEQKRLVTIVASLDTLQRNAEHPKGPLDINHLVEAQMEAGDMIRGAEVVPLVTTVTGGMVPTRGINLPQDLITALNTGLLQSLVTTQVTTPILDISLMDLPSRMVATSNNIQDTMKGNPDPEMGTSLEGTRGGLIQRLLLSLTLRMAASGAHMTRTRNTGSLERAVANPLLPEPNSAMRNFSRDPGTMNAYIVVNRATGQRNAPTGVLSDPLKDPGDNKGVDIRHQETGHQEAGRQGPPSPRVKFGIRSMESSPQEPSWEGDDWENDYLNEDAYHEEQVEEYLSFCAVNDQIHIDSREMGDPPTEFE